MCEKKGTDEITINRNKEPLFKRLLAKIINEETHHEEKDLLLSLAFLMEVSPMTVESTWENRAQVQGCMKKSKPERVLLCNTRNELSKLCTQRGMILFLPELIYLSF